MDAIERFEVSVRAQWAYHLAHTYGPHAHLNAGIFEPPRLRPKWDHADSVISLQKMVAKSSENFIRHLRTTYHHDALPPLWAICEIMTFGELSTWYANLLLRQDRQAIAKIYDTDEVILVSFMHHLNMVRNFCAHHSRLWNREFTIIWTLPTVKPFPILKSLNRSEPKRIYNSLVMLAYLMDIINPGHFWKARLGDIFSHHPKVRPQAMGFPENWRELPVWRGKV